MCRQLRITIYLLLITLSISCNPQTPPPSLQTTFFIYRFNPSAFVEFSKDFQPIQEIPFAVPLNCGLLNTFPAPIGKYILIELNCPTGQTVLFLDTDSSTMTQPITDSDSHFLAWSSDGQAAYLKVDSLGNTHIARVSVEGKNDFIPITEFTYDLAADPRNHDFTFTFSRGMGQGSEFWLAKGDGNIVQQLYSDPFNYISFARYSPDGSQIAFIKIPDAQTPFTVGELWTIPSTSTQGINGSNPRKLADADAGHGYAANWSPNGKRIAFVVRENPKDERADQSAEALISNIYVVDVQTGVLTQITRLENGRVETSFWSPDGNTLAFNAVINDRMEVQIADLRTGQIRSLLGDSVCCPAWIRK